MRNLFRIGLGVALAAAGVAIAVLLVGEERSPGPATPATAAPSQRGQKVTFIHVVTETRAAEFYARRFQEETGGAVQTVAVSFQALASSAMDDWSSATPHADIFQMHYTDVGMFVERGMLLDLSGFIRQHRERIRPEDYLPGVLEAYGLHGGRTWAIPYDNDSHLLFYRKSILARNNLEPPRTWDDFTQVARTITERERAQGIYGTAIMAHPLPMFVVSTFMNRLSAYGGRLLDDAARPTVNSPEAVAALSVLVEQARYALPTPVETDFDVSRFAFLSGRVAMVEQWSDVGIMAEDATMSTIQGDWGAVRLPIGTGPKAQSVSALNAGFVLGVSSKAPNPEAALAFLLTVANPRNELQGNLINGGLDPTRISVLTSQEYRDFTPIIAEAKRASLQGAVPWPTLPQTPRLLEALSEGLVRAINARQTPREALDEVQAVWVRELATK